MLFIYLSVFLLPLPIALLLFRFVESASMLLPSSSELNGGNMHAWLVMDKWDTV